MYERRRIRSPKKRGLGSGSSAGDPKVSEASDCLGRLAGRWQARQIVVFAWGTWLHNWVSLC